jgi:hypothetical protein
MLIRRILLSGLALSLILGGAWIAYLVGSNPFKQDFEGEYRRRVENELPIGTDRGAVEAWLVAEGLTYGDVSQGSDHRRVGIFAFNRDLPGYKSLVCDAEIYFEFQFVEQNRLLSRLVRLQPICL